MTSLSHQINNPMNLQPVYYPDQNAHTLMSTTLRTNGERSQEQPIVYYNAPMNRQTGNNPQFYQYNKHPLNSQMVNQSSTSETMSYNQQQQHQHIASINMPNALLQHATLHSNTNPQQTFVAIHPSHEKITASSYSSVMTNPTHATRNNITNNMSNKRRRGIYQRNNEGPIASLNLQNRTHRPTQNPIDNEQKPSIATCRFAASRFPFSPYSLVFTQEVREKLVVDELIKYTKDVHNFELKTVAYRKGKSENNECRILIFVENSESFAFLHDKKNWPSLLAECQFTMKIPLIPPQLSLVLPVVSFRINWEEFVQELKDNYPGIAYVIRLKNKAQQPVRAVKLEFLSPKLREEILAAGEISIMHMKLKVVQYFSQANVLICSNCFDIGHFRKNCTQKDQATCKTCGDKCVSLKERQCSGIKKCIHCGGPHDSNDTKCKVVKDYRAALTRNILANTAAKSGDGVRSNQATTVANMMSYKSSHPTYATAVQSTPPNSNEIIFKKLDSILAKVEEESAITRQSLEEVKHEMRNRYEETNQKFVELETKVRVMEKELEDFSMRILRIMQNVCTSFLDPEGVQISKWKAYWQEQIKMITELRSTCTAKFT